MTEDLRSKFEADVDSVDNPWEKVSIDISNSALFYKNDKKGGARIFNACRVIFQKYGNEVGQEDSHKGK